MLQKNIARPIYLKKIEPYFNQDVIKIIIGQRRVGKSYFLAQIKDKLEKDYGYRHFIKINKELHDFAHINNENDLISFVKGNSNKLTKSKIALFIDEIQDIKNFEKALRSLQASGGYDIYCTGSNANILSGELATYLSGRYIEIPIYSLSYEEFLIFHNLADSQEALEKYIRYGGLPYLRNLSLEDAIVYDYLKNVYQAIIYKDVVARFQIRNLAFLERLIEYLADNVGSFVSAHKISDFMKSQKTSLSPSVVLNYLSFLASAHLIFKVRRSQIGGKKIFEINEKYYFEDLGLRHAIIGYRQIDINKILENLVFLHLKINGFTVTIGHLTQKEIDFVAEKGAEKIYIQVVYLMKEQSTRDREFGNLLAIDDNFPKLVISMDELAGGSFKGIKHLHIRDFLKNNLDY